MNGSGCDLECCYEKLIFSAGLSGEKSMFSRYFFCGANETVAGQIQKNRSNPRSNARVCSKTGERGKLRSEVSGNSMRRSGKSMRKVKISINSNGLGETIT